MHVLVELLTLLLSKDVQIADPCLFHGVFQCVIVFSLLNDTHGDYTHITDTLALTYAVATLFSSVSLEASGLRSRFSVRSRSRPCLSS